MAQELNDTARIAAEFMIASALRMARENVDQETRDAASDEVIDFLSHAAMEGPGIEPDSAGRMAHDVDIQNLFELLSLIRPEFIQWMRDVFDV